MAFLRNSPELLLQTQDFLQISVFNYLNERRSEHCGILMDVCLDDNSLKEKSAFWQNGTSVDISFSALNLMMEIFNPLFIVFHTPVGNFAKKCATQGTLWHLRHDGTLVNVDFRSHSRLLKGIERAQFGWYTNISKCGFPSIKNTICIVSFRPKKIDWKEKTTLARWDTYKSQCFRPQTSAGTPL